MYLVKSLLSLSRTKKRAVSIIIDALGLLIAVFLAVWLRFGESGFPIISYAPAILLLPVIALPIFIIHGLYRAVVRYIGYRFALTVFVSVTTLFIVWAAAIYMLNLNFPRSAIVITWLLVLFYISATRLLARWLFSEGLVKKARLNKSMVIIFGAGISGQQLLSAMEKIPTVNVVGFIDDDVSLQKHDIGSVKVYARNDIEKLIADYAVETIYLAIPSVSAFKRRAILEWLEPYAIKVMTLPSIDEIVSGKVSFSDIREVDIEDLLGREPVPPKEELLSKCIADQVVMVTGAGGSIGSELCRQVLKQNPKALILYEMSEFALYGIEHELVNVANDGCVTIIAVLGSVLNGDKLKKVIQKYRVDTIYHAAAYKHVPIVEHNIEEGVLNNTFGTHVAAKISAENGVKNFVLISTDKAVRPTNVMGASKRMAEMVLQALQQEFINTRFLMVRFGNVLGSSGSVIPLFRKQIKSGGPVTVTHPEITRYFMTIPEAASLVIQASSMGKGGDVFVLDMGEPVKIDLLARRVIKLSGLTVIDEEGEGDIEIQYTGLRPGEKLYEELLIGDDVGGTDHPRIMSAHEEFLPYSQLREELDVLYKHLKSCHYTDALVQIEVLVPGFKHTSGVVDYLN